MQEGSLEMRQLFPSTPVPLVVILHNRLSYHFINHNSKKNETASILSKDQTKTQKYIG